MEEYTGIENTDESERRTKAKKRLITVITIAAVVGLVVFLISGGANAYSCNPQDLNCAGNLPSGDLSSTSKNWFESLMSSVTGLFVITTIPTAEGVTQEYVWSDKITVPSGPYGGCELLYQCGDVGYVSKRDLGIQELKLGSTMEFDFSCRCSTTGIVSARFGCWQQGYQSYYTEWSKVFTVPCLFAPKETPTPGIQPTPCTVVWNPPVCEGSNSVEKSDSCGSPNRKETPCIYGCNTANGKCNTQPTDGCIPVFRDKTCENNIQYKVALNCGTMQKEAEVGCQYGCYGGICASAPQVTSTPTAVPTSTAVPTATQGPTSTAVPTSTAAPTSTAIPHTGKYLPPQWEEKCGIDLNTLDCPKGITDVRGVTWKEDGCPSSYACISEGPPLTTPTTDKGLIGGFFDWIQGGGAGEVHIPTDGAGEVITTDKGLIGGFFDWINNFIKGIFEALFGKK